MSLPALIATLLGLSLTAYAAFAGADFGAGVLDLLAGRRDSDRDAIAATIGPVWEANHVWLIFSITLLFSAFPRAFSALGTKLLAPLTVALLAIVLRSAALGLRGSSDGKPRSRVRLSLLFGAASLLAPFAFGTVAGALASASAGTQTAGTPIPNLPWTSGFALLAGGLAVALCTLLASSFVALAMVRSGDRELVERFRVRGLQSAGSVIVLSAAALAVAASTSPALWHRLSGPGLPLVIVGLCGALLSVIAFRRRSFVVARGAALLTSAAVLWGWFVSQAPHLIGTRLTIHTAAATHPALVAIAIASAIVLVLVLPAMFLLFTVFARPELELHE
jgi:cytochrome bd ubiquinol oxidase subunit II